MKFLIGISLILLAFIAIILLVMFSFIIRFLLKVRKHMRGDFTDEEVERFSKKYHQQTNNYQFSKDYFKRREDPVDNNAESRRRTTQATAEGVTVTIIDDRQPDVAQRKIFDKDEGEYVDFKEY